MNFEQLISDFYKLAQMVQPSFQQDYLSSKNKAGQEQSLAPKTQPATPPAKPLAGEVRDRFKGTEGAERQQLMQQEAAAKGFTLVPNKITPLNEADVKKALRIIVDEKFQNVEPAQKEMLVMMFFAQIKLETGMKSSHNFNVGNVHATKGGRSKYWTGAVSAWDDPQIIKGKQVINKDFFWRAFDSLEAGVGDYVSLLERRFPQAVDAAKRGDVRGFVESLKKSGYFTADLERYYKAVVSIVNSQQKASKQ